MNLQLGFGIAGAALGFVIGLAGGIIALAPFGIIVLRSFLLALILGAVFFGIYVVISKFLPELFAQTETSDHDGLSPRIDISIQDEDGALDEDAKVGGYARPGLGTTQVDMDALAAQGETSSIMEELHDKVPSSMQAEESSGSGFNEDAFYSGISHLPDIGNLSNQFTEGESAPEESSASPSYDLPERKKDKNSNMDPALIAKAIRTALKKEEQ